MPDDQTPTPTPDEQPESPSANELSDRALEAVSGGVAGQATPTPTAPKKRGGATGVWADASGHFD